MENKLKDTLIIIVNGKPESGKTYLCDEFIKKQIDLENHGESFLKSIMYTPIDRIKRCAKSYFGWNGDKSIGSRSMLADLYQFDIDHNNETFKEMTKFINRWNENGYKIVFINIRNIDQITLLQEYLSENSYRVRTMYMYTDSKDSITYDNKADDSVEHFDYDIVFKNNKDDKSFYDFCDIVITNFKIMKACQN